MPLSWPGGLIYTVCSLAKFLVRSGFYRDYPTLSWGFAYINGIQLVCGFFCSTRLLVETHWDRRSLFEQIGDDERVGWSIRLIKGITRPQIQNYLDYLGHQFAPRKLLTNNFEA